MKTEKGIELTKGDFWFLTISRNMSFWHECLSDEGHYDHMKDFGVNANLDGVSIAVNGTETSIFWHNPNLNIFMSATLSAVDSYKKINALTRRYHLYAKLLLNSLEECKENTNSKNLKKFFREYSRFCAGLMITVAIGRLGSDLLNKKLYKKKN